MNVDRLRPLFRSPHYDNDGAHGYLDWSIYDQLPRGVRRWWRLSYDIERRQFHASLYRSETDESPLDIEVPLGPRMTDFLRSMLPPEELARCLAASIAA